MAKYPISPEQADPLSKLMRDLENRFTYHAPKDDQPPRYVAIRAKALELAELILMETPASREQSLAFTHLEEVTYWANAAIARHE